MIIEERQETRTLPDISSEEGASRNVRLCSCLFSFTNDLSSYDWREPSILASMKLRKCRLSLKLSGAGRSQDINTPYPVSLSTQCLLSSANPSSCSYNIRGRPCRSACSKFSLRNLRKVVLGQHHEKLCSSETEQQSRQSTMLTTFFHPDLFLRSVSFTQLKPNEFK